MNKKEVQKRVSKDGKPLALSKFEWDEKTNTFSSMEDGLVLDFREMHNCTFTTGPNCTFTTGYYCTFDTGFNCTFDTGFDCTFKTGPNCTFKTGSNCTFKTGPNCTFKTGSNCVIVRRDVFEIVQPQKGQVIQLCPHGIEGHLINGELGGVPHIIADGILSRIVKKKGNVCRVVNHGETEESWIIKDGDDYAHGETLEDARNSLVYKRKDRDKSAYEGNPGDMVSKAEVDRIVEDALYRLKAQVAKAVFDNDYMWDDLAELGINPELEKESNPDDRVSKAVFNGCIW